MTRSGQIEIERDGSIVTIRLNRPRYRNAQSRIMLEEMTQAFADADNDTSVRVIVLAGAGDHFSAGHDLGTPEEVEDRVLNPNVDLPGSSGVGFSHAHAPGLKAPEQCCSRKMFHHGNSLQAHAVNLGGVLRPRRDRRTGFRGASPPRAP